MKVTRWEFKTVLIERDRGNGYGQRISEIVGYVYNRLIDTRFKVFRTFIDTTVELTQSFVEPIGFNLSPGDVLYFVADTDTNGANVRIRFSLNQYQRD